MQPPSDLNLGSNTLLAHMSDPHLPLVGGVPPAALLNKRLLGLLSWHVKRHRHHRAETLARLTADMCRHAPDWIAVTGDLTNLGLEREYRHTRAWLDTLGTPQRVMVVPGNHDALVRGAWDRGRAYWRPYWQGDEATAPQEIPGTFPVLRRRGPLALIGVSSAIASPAGLAVGQVGRAQMNRLVALLRRARAAGLCRVLLIHHPLLDGTVRRRKRLRDAADLRALLAAEGVELILHGHSHRSHHQQLQTRDGPAPVIGVPSASSMHREPAAYHLYRIGPDARGWKIALTARRLGADGKMETGRCATLAIERGQAG